MCGVSDPAASRARCERSYINLVTGDYVNARDAVGCKC